MRILRSVLLPIAWPPVLTLATLMFIWSWNEFLLSLVVLDRGTRTAPAGLGIFTGQWVSDIPPECRGHNHRPSDNTSICITQPKNHLWNTPGSGKGLMQEEMKNE